MGEGEYQGQGQIWV